jgi:hypothetical protein
MVTASHLSVEQPRISANQLGVYPFLTPNEKLRTLRDQKFGNPFRSPYYHSAACSLLRAFQGDNFDRDEIEETIAQLELRTARNPNHAAKLRNNVEMLRRFLAIAGKAVPPEGEHRIVRRDARMELDGVVVSVRPEIVTLSRPTGLFSFTKLRFAKGKVSGDASEIILLVLLKYGQQTSIDGLQIDPESTRLVDCYSGEIIPGHTLPRIREQQLQAALREIRRLWPQITSDIL